ncbi:hypothetical protein GCM10010121_008030 [Streptomyces brasiliensis]|uniref:Uncharacterized protein n=1 Tax=Streptomyces brasiliensis TaxID=1954 RepID=A0A917K4S2_9ACTN|nr:hypothetical protein GCM10010121_008030 [Streptomyces brasiliensis]
MLVSATATTFSGLNVFDGLSKDIVRIGLTESPLLFTRGSPASKNGKGQTCTDGADADVLNLTGHDPGMTRKTEHRGNKGPDKISQIFAQLCRATQEVTNGEGENDVKAPHFRQCA